MTASSSKKGTGTVEADSRVEFLPADEASTAGSFPQGYVVQVTIIGARGLDGGDCREGQISKGPYCTCEIPGKPRSSVSTPPSGGGTCDPTWNCPLVMPSYVFPDALAFTVFDGDSDDCSSHLGRAQVSASKLKAGYGKFEGQLPLVGASIGKSAPLLEVRIEAVPRLASGGAAGDPAELPLGRLVRLNIRKAPDQELGVLLHTSVRGEVVVLELSPNGAAAEYNRGAKVRDQLQVGDCIVEVNGLTEGLVKELGASEDLELLVECRSYIFKAEIDKPKGTSLGMDISFKKDGELLCISAIVEGAVSCYNAVASEEKKIRRGDHILSVNGVWDPQQRLEELKKGSGPTELLIRRVCGLPCDAFAPDAAPPKTA